MSSVFRIGLPPAAKFSAGTLEALAGVSVGLVLSSAGIASELAARYEGPIEQRQVFDLLLTQLLAMVSCGVGLSMAPGEELAGDDVLEELLELLRNTWVEMRERAELARELLRARRTATQGDN
jgi:hypothetical protein